jgi:cellobiose phosphorylase
MVLGGVASPERAIQAMNSARDYLDTPRTKILHPAYTAIDRESAWRRAALG